MAVGALFWRRSRLFAATSAARRVEAGTDADADTDTMTTGARKPAVERPDTGGERWYLDDEREFLLRSIDDAAPRA